MSAVAHRTLARSRGASGKVGAEIGALRNEMSAGSGYVQAPDGDIPDGNSEGVRVGASPAREQQALDAGHRGGYDLHNDHSRSHVGACAEALE